MVDRIAILSAVTARVVVPHQNEAAKLLIAVKAPDRMAARDDGGAFPHEGNRQIRLDLLIPAAAVIALAEHANEALSCRSQTGRIAGIGFRSIRLWLSLYRV